MLIATVIVLTFAPIALALVAPRGRVFPAPAPDAYEDAAGLWVVKRASPGCWTWVLVLPART
jgi:hypothetical protein